MVYMVATSHQYRLGSKNPRGKPSMLQCSYGAEELVTGVERAKNEQSERKEKKKKKKKLTASHVARVLPRFEANLPASQSVQLSCESNGWYCPAEQNVQLVASLAQFGAVQLPNFPAAHSLHDLLGFENE